MAANETMGAAGAPTDSTLHYSRDESSTAAALSGSTSVQRSGTRSATGSPGGPSHSRPHSRAPSQKSPFNPTKSLASAPMSSTEDGDNTTETDTQGVEPGESVVEGYDPAEDEDEPVANEEGQHFWVNTRHLTSGKPASSTEEEASAPPWRLRSRLKTFSGALTLCLNLGIDPPDIVKTNPCAKLECWVDPESLPPNKALEGIGRNIQQQFETLSPKVRYKQYLDPSVEDTKKFCINLRRQAKDERVLMYYNGHGVPKPTTSGEIWVFNKSLTQYIPVSLYDLQSWLGSPCIFVWDCSAAGNIINNFNRWAEKRDAENVAAVGQRQANGASADEAASPTEGTYTSFLNCIHLAACQADQTLPMSPELPADLFTCCLTSPIEIALRFFVLQDPLRNNVDPNDPKAKITVDLVMKIPGDLKERRTPLGELNWIFTAVTDTIAWLVFPNDVFKRLFRQDLLVAALFRNYLLAERIMRSYNCTPMSHPQLPATHNHPLWDSWDLAVDACLNQLPALLEAEAKAKENPNSPPTYEYQPSRFFTEHLTAFEVWLEHDGTVSGDLVHKTSSLDNQNSNKERRDSPVARKPPDQLPIVLQVLLSQTHRLRALILLSKFVDLGPWAVRMALSIGIFPYVQKLLQSPAVDLKPVLIFIWGRILAHDRSCQVDLLKDNGFGYFAEVLAPPTPQNSPLLIPNASEHRAMCAFILSMVCRGFKQGQMACLSFDVFRSCFVRLQEHDWLLKQWSALCIAQMWAEGNDEAKMLAIREGYQDRLIFMLKDNATEVRAAAMYALGTFLGATGMPAVSTSANGVKGNNTSHPSKSGGGGTGAQLGLTERHQLKLEAGVAQACVLQAKEDASPIVRKELIVILSCVVREWRGWFVAAAWTYYEMEERRARRELGIVDDNTSVDGDDLVDRAMVEWGNRNKERFEDPVLAHEEHEENKAILSIFKLMLETLLELSVDPHPEVASLACTVTDYLTALLMDSAFTRASGSSLKMSVCQARLQRLGSQTELALPTLTSPGLDPHPQSRPDETQQQQDPPTSAKSEPRSKSKSSTSKMASTLKRSSSVANALKGLAFITGYSSDKPAEPKDQPENNKQEPAPKLTRSETSSSLHSQPYIPPYPMARTETDTSIGSSHKSSDKVPRSASMASMVHSQMKSEFSFTSLNGSHGPNSINESGPKPRKFTAGQVVQALTDEDMERLNIRRSARSQAGTIDRKYANEGRPQSNDLGLGMVAKEVKDDVLPLRSDFYDYSMQYFKEPQMRIRVTEEPGSVEYNEQAWRQQRNHRITEYSRAADAVASHSPWTNELGKITNEAWPCILQFHSYDPHLAVSDETDNICIWDWKEREKLSKFSLGNARGSAISSLHFVNETAASLLLTASTDGSIRIYRDCESTDTVKLASAFHGLAEKQSVSRRSGVVTSWEQRTGHLLVAGDSKYIRVWDAGIESLLLDFPTQAGSNVTAIASDQMGGDMFAAGFGDGVVRLFDKRMGEDRGVVKVLRQHHQWIKSVGVLQGDSRDLISASMNGDVKIWDIRHSDIPISSTNVFANGLSSMAVHSQAPIFAATSAPYASSSYNTSREAQGGGQGGGVRRGQRLSVYRMVDDEQRLSPDPSYDASTSSPTSSMRSGSRYSGLPSEHRMSYGYASSTGPSLATSTGADTNGPQPCQLSSIMLRGDAAHASAVTSSRGGPGMGGSYTANGYDARDRQARGQSSGHTRKWGAGMNGLAFHPTELVLAVGGFDHQYGSVSLISYDKPKDQSGLDGHAWE